LGLNLALTLGSVSEKVQVTGAALLVNTQTTEVGTLIGKQMIEDLPLNTRNPIQLMTLSTGITREGVALTMAGPPDARQGAAGQSSTMSVNGNRVTMGEYLLDGTEFSLPTFNSGPNYPNPDALEEFRFISSNYSAAFGKKPGGVMNAVTKSGTNSFHGGAWSSTATATWARAVFPPDQSLPQSESVRIQPRRANPQEQAFFFGTYQGLRIAQGRSSTSQYPLTTDERNGNLTAAAFHPTAIRDPLLPAAGGTSGVSRQDHSREPDRRDRDRLHEDHSFAQFPDGRWLGAVAEPLTNYQWMPKGDYIINDKQRLWFPSSAIHPLPPPARLRPAQSRDYGRATYPAS
jgi:hypothetical protein